MKRIFATFVVVAAMVLLSVPSRAATITFTGDPGFLTYDGTDFLSGLTISTVSGVDSFTSGLMFLSSSYFLDSSGSPQLTGLAVWSDGNDPVFTLDFESTFQTFQFDRDSFSGAGFGTLSYSFDDGISAFDFDVPSMFNVSMALSFTSEDDGFQEFETSDVIIAATPVPEPGTMMLFGSGLVGLVGWGRKRLRK